MENIIKKITNNPWVSFFSAMGSIIGLLVLLYSPLQASLELFLSPISKKENYSQNSLIGSWKCGTLYRNHQPVSNPNTIIFDFKLDSTYNYSGGGYSETGKWWLEGDKLVTVAEGDLEKKVQIEKVNADTLIMNMNDRGTEMKLILLPQ